MRHRFLGSAGLDQQSEQILATVGIGLVLVLFTMAAIWLVDRLGRRPLLTFGFAVTSVSLLGIGLDATLGDPDLGWVSIVGLVLYIAAFAVSVGPVPYVLMSETFPLRVRGPGMSMASLSHWCFNFLVVLTFPSLLHYVGLSGTFWLYAIFCAVGLVFTRVLVPETRGLQLEEIERHLLSRSRLRDIGR
jgi:SP family galactose:H+ symporter-like MFS transporter